MKTIQRSKLTLTVETEGYMYSVKTLADIVLKTLYDGEIKSGVIERNNGDKAIWDMESTRNNLVEETKEATD